MIRLKQRRQTQGDFMTIKKIGGVLLCVCLAMNFGGCEEHDSQAVKDQARNAIESIREAAEGFSNSEPEEVQELRKQDVAQSDGVHSEYFFRQLSEGQQRIYREILNGIQQYEEKIYISSADSDDIDLAYHAVLQDHPEVFWVHNRETTYTTFYSTYSEFEPGYRISQDEIPDIQEAMDGAYQQIISGFSQDVTDYDKARAVYEYVISNTVYEYSDDDQSIAGVFRDGQAVCAGYAGAVQYLLERMGVECLYVTGDMKNSAEDHAWNVVNLDGNYYYLDATNGDQPGFLQEDEVEVSEGTVLYDYLCPFPAEYENMVQSHDQFSLPECTATDQNYYVRNGSCFSGYDGNVIYQYACSQIDQGMQMIHFKFTDAAGYQAAVNDLIDNRAVEQIAQYYMDYYGMQQIQYHYGVLEDLNTIYFML